jgi:hypothetical protein
MSCVQLVPQVVSSTYASLFPDLLCLCSLERVVVLELFVLAPETGGLINCSLSNFSILKIVSNRLLTSQATHISLRMCNYCEGNEIIVVYIPRHTSHR